ncbi:Hypothetical protein FKW44_008059 [Caligus rogercresseyi]|uniref:Uncharacterized protein n=1 Tax=Caligus rogercresseyi TaxID=217165 RepID=A0A7T8QU14_CALRO|nr:Hypothetical protein FKW44_008059 [Caligus rogercresseyi]
MLLDSLLIEKLNPRKSSSQARQQAQAVEGALQLLWGGTVGTFIKNRAHVIRWAGLPPPIPWACIKLERPMESEMVGKDSALLLK